MKPLEYKEYIVSDVWKCEDSPTNAHYWMEVQTEEHFHTGLWYCKWCYETKEMPDNRRHSHSKTRYIGKS